MDGVHDLGGMDGFGPIDHSPSEPTFHADWERRVFAMVLITMAQGQYSMDAFRHAIERMAPAWYLASPYYEHWLAAMETLLVERDVVDAADLTDRIDQYSDADRPVPERADPELVTTMRSLFEYAPSARRGDGEPAFAVDDRVRVKNRHPAGHTRCPGYVRRAEGTVTAVHGAHVLPDANAHGRGEQPEPLYAVRFDGEALWGEAAEANTAVSVDLWESYLEAP